MRSPNYDKYPATRTEGALFHGWEAIREALDRERRGPLAVDWYAGVHEAEITEGLLPGFSRIIRMRDLMKPEAEIRRMTDPFMTDDVLFGYVTNLRMPDFFDAEKLAAVRAELETAGEDVLILGTGAALVAPQHAVLAYADMARWEIQQRFRRHEVCGLGVDNREDPVSIQYKRGLFIDWRVLDYYKDTLFARVDWWIDTNAAGDPKMISRETFFRGIDKTARKPFRVVPFFDPAPWGGQWMKDVCDLDREVPNFGWCFDCVPEENSLLLEVEGVKFELPSNDLILLRAREETRVFVTDVVEFLVDERLDVAFPLVFVHLVETDHDTCLDGIAEFVVERGRETLHRGGQVDVGVDERRDVRPEVPDGFLQAAVILAEVAFAQDQVRQNRVGLEADGVVGAHQFVRVVEMLGQEAEDEVACDVVVQGIDGHLPDEIQRARVFHGDADDPVPQVVHGEEGLGAGFRTLVFGGDE